MISFQSMTSFSLPCKRKHKNWISQLIIKNGKRVGDINYLFCDDQYLLKINQEYLQHNTLTDIITFDYVEEDHISGDIAISIERVKENAVLYNVSLSDELLRVMAHGVLHLLGYQDKTKEDQQLMREREREAIELYSLIQ